MSLKRMFGCSSLPSANTLFKIIFDEAVSVAITLTTVIVVVTLHAQHVMSDVLDNHQSRVGLLLLRLTLTPARLLLLLMQLRVCLLCEKELAEGSGETISHGLLAGGTCPPL